MIARLHQLVHQPIGGVVQRRHVLVNQREFSVELYILGCDQFAHLSKVVLHGGQVERIVGAPADSAPTTE